MTQRPSELIHLAGDRGLVESPRWHNGRWWFADWTAGEIMTLDNDDGALTTVVQAPAPPLCFDFLPDGSLLFVSSRAGKLVRRTPNGAPATYAVLSR